MSPMSNGQLIKTCARGVALSLAVLFTTVSLSFAQATPTPAITPASLLQLRGSVATSDGTPLRGVLVVSSFGASDVTNSKGEFSFTGLANNLQYTLSFRKFGYSFSPETVSGTLATDTNLQITASVFLVNIRGLVTRNGIPLPGVIINGGTLASTVTDANGIYQFSNVPFGTKVTLTPVGNGKLSFRPAKSNFIVRSNREIDFLVDEFVTVVNACSDGIDNDSDGATDFPSDIGCLSGSDRSEVRPSGPQCDDGKDNDHDGLFDRADPDCSAAADITEGIAQPNLTCTMIDFASPLSLLEDRFERTVDASLNSLGVIAKKLSRASRRDSKEINEQLRSLRSQAEILKSTTISTVGGLPAQVLECPARRRCSTRSLSAQNSSLRNLIARYSTLNLVVTQNFDRIAARKAPRQRKALSNSRATVKIETASLLELIKTFPRRTSVCGN